MPKTSHNEQPKGKLLLSLFFLQKLQRLARLVSGHQEKIPFIQDKETLAKNLKRLQSFLSSLKQTNQSRNMLFIQDMASTWKLLESLSSRLLATSHHPFSLASKLQHFLLSLKNHSVNSEYTLGYYLLQDVGPEWTPFPFLQMLENLHTDYIEKKENSFLSIWSQTLEDILDRLD